MDQKDSSFPDSSDFPPETEPISPEKPRTIGELAREFGITQRALRFYQSKGLLAPIQNGSLRLYDSKAFDRLALILQGKRLGFTLTEIRQMLNQPRPPGTRQTLPITRKACNAQIALLERQQREIETAIVELRHIYTEMFVRSIEPAKPGESDAA